MFLSQLLREKIDFYHAFLTPDIEITISKMIEIEKNNLRRLRSSIFSKKQSGQFLERLRLLVNRSLNGTEIRVTGDVVVKIVNSKLIHFKISRPKKKAVDELLELFQFIFFDIDVKLFIR